MTWKSRMAAVAGLAASVMLAYLAVSGDTVGSVAFAQVMDKLRGAQTMSFDSQITRQSDGKILSQGRNRLMVPGKVRIEFDGDQGLQSYFVIDSRSVKMLTVDEKQKSAQISPLKGFENKDIAAREIDRVRSLDDQGAQPLGNKLINGVNAKGFAIDRETVTTTVWADATSVPIQIEILEKNFPDGPILQVWSNIKLDEPLDPKLFGTEPPAGFSVKPFVPIDFNKPRIHYVADFLKIYAKHMDGQFPPQLHDAIKPLAEKLKPAEGESPSEDLMQLAFNGAGMFAVTLRNKAGEDWQYYPDHKLGAKTQIVFWMHDSRDGQYWAVYGDLRVEVVSPQQLPPRPKEPPANE